MTISQPLTKSIRPHAVLWAEAAKLQGRLLAEGWTLKYHAQHVEGSWVYHCTAYRPGLRKGGYKAAASTPLAAIAEAVRLARVELDARIAAPAGGN